MAANDHPDQVKQLLEVCSQAEGAELKVLHNAQIKCLRSYQDDPTFQRKKDWDAAKAGLDECVNRLWYRYFGEEEVEGEPDPETDPARPLLLGTGDVARFFGVTAKCVSNDWRKAGCPQVKYGTWDLKQVFDWWWENIASERAAKMGGDESINEAKRQYWWSKAEEGQLKVSQAREDLIDKTTVHKQWAQRMAEYKNGCFGLVNLLPPLLEGKNQGEMREAIEDYVWGMFKRVCRYGKFCKQQPQAKKATPAKKKGGRASKKR